MTRSRDLSNDQANVGGAVAPYVAGKNAVINGGFDIWQRGTSFAIGAGNAYTADRWSFLNPGTGNFTISRQATSDTTNLPNIQYCLRLQRNSGQTATTVNYLTQSMETVNSIPFAGKTITFSFYARAGANYSPTSSILSLNVSSGTGTDQNINSSFTGLTTVISQYATLTTTWQRFTYTGSVASTATQLGYYFNWTPTGTAGANDYFEITGVQLEIGSIATPFSRAGGSIGGELALCQRYYYRIIPNPGTSYCRFSSYAPADSTTSLAVLIQPAVTMRTVPNVLEYSNLTLYGGGFATFTNAVISVDCAPQLIQIGVSGSGMTQFRPYALLANNTSNSYLAIGAEL